ncbi:MAG: hypothetical protein GY778_24785 [bacterium]|nr:hypothetical protein [bacterium]
MQTVIILRTDQLGEGDRDLGVKILATCLRKLPAFDGLEAIVLYNAGVKLATTDSPVATELTLLHEHGVDVLPCSTCVEHYGLADRLIVPNPSTMDEILSTLRSAEKVITL